MMLINADKSEKMIFLCESAEALSSHIYLLAKTALCSDFYVNAPNNIARLPGCHK